MSKKTKKILIIAGIALDVAITIFLFAVSIIMLATLPDSRSAIDGSTFIGYLQLHPTTVFLPAFVLPLILLLVLNITILVIYLRKASKQKAVEMDELSEAEKEALKAELLKDLQNNKEN